MTPLPPEKKRGDPLFATDVNQITGGIRELRGVPGNLVGGQLAQTRRGTRYERFGTIISATAVVGTEDTNSNPTQWTYTLSEVIKTSEGYGGWSVPDAGHYQGPAFNMFEDGNTGVGLQMNGVDHDGDDYPPGFMMQPIPVNAIVKFHLVMFVDGPAEAWFSVPNSEDGTCAA